MDLEVKRNLHKLVYIHSPIAEDVLYFIYMHEYPEIDGRLMDTEDALGQAYKQIEILSGFLAELIEEGKVIKEGDSVFDPAVNIFDTESIEQHTN